MKRLVALSALFLLALPARAKAQEQWYDFSTRLGLTETALKLPFDSIQSITSIDLGGDGTSELVLGSPPGFVGQVFLVRLDGSIINSWPAYDANFRGGVNVAQADLDGDGAPEIITAPAGGGGPHVRIFDGYGKPKISPGFFAADASYTKGVRIGIKRLSDIKPLAITAMLDAPGGSVFSAFTPSGELIKSYPVSADLAESKTINLSVWQDNEESVLALPATTRAIERGGKVIIIDLSDQLLSYYEDGYRMGTFLTSTGKPGYETPRGEHAINGKSEKAYSKRYGLFMPYWMSFIGGLYGIHELPYWPNGYREGEDHLGSAVSHGCVRLGVGAAQTLYEWADIGTPVIVRE